MGPLTMRRIRWGILGTGQIAASFAEGLRAVPDAELAAVGSRTPETAAAFAARWGAPRAFGSYREVAASPEVDAVYVATVNPSHRADCLLCLDAGKAVLCEKPVALHAADAEAIVARARERQVFFMEAMWMRCFPMVQKARALVRSGAIGEPCLLQADFGFPVPLDPANRFLNLALGGGSLVDRGIYPLSLAWFLFGAPTAIDGHAAIGATGVDEQSTMMLHYANGAQAVLSSTMKTYGTNRALVTGTHGSIELTTPFFCTERLVHTRFPVAAAPGAAAVAAPESSVRRLLRRAKHAAFRAAGRRADQTIYTEPRVGNGYNYEAAEVGRCLRAGLLESPLMPLAESLEILRAMDTLRAGWGIVYPGETVPPA